MEMIPLIMEKDMYKIEDISKITGLSISIISRYLNGHNVRKENKILIDEAVQKTGYTPNEFARSLRVKQTKTVGAIMPSLDDNFALSIMHYVEMALKKQGYSLFLTDCLHNPQDEINCVKMMIQKRVDALIVLPVGNFSEISILAKQNKTPLIIFDQYFENISADYVLFENKEGAYRAGEILVEYGHKNIYVIVGPLSDYTPRQRLQGFQNCMEKNNIPFTKENIFESKDYSMQSGYDITMNILNSSKKPTALFTTNFDMTLGAIKAINEKELIIPEDISLMAFDLLHIYEALKPKLWTVVQPIDKIGEQVAKQVLYRISNSNDLPYTTHFIKYDLKEGKSIKKLK
jgi:DNA-binding LacI/PurR family transcriptional regulator